MALEWIVLPTINLSTKRKILHTIPKIPPKTPYAERTEGAVTLSESFIKIFVKKRVNKKTTSQAIIHQKENICNRGNTFSYNSTYNVLRQLKILKRRYMTMCGICRTVNCIRRRLFGCGCSCNDNYDCHETYSYRGCDTCERESRCGCSSRFTEPDTNVICANQRNNGFTPCCGDDECRCHKHHHNNCCE